MPELPEAETIARELGAAIAGRVIGAVVIARRDIVHGDVELLEGGLEGRRVSKVYRRAKRVIVRVEGGAELTFRLGMTGRVEVCSAGTPVEKHTHLRIALARWNREVRFRDPRRFGGVWCHRSDEGHGKDHLGEHPAGVPAGDETEHEDDLGPEPLELTAREFRRVLGRTRQIKALLMDQRAIAGLGNIYCDESLHAAGMHPLRRADSLDGEEAKRLLRCIKAVLRKAIRHNGTTLMDYRRPDGAEGSFQRHHRVYQREGKTCRDCGTQIERIVAAGRSTFFCPRCQRI